MISPRRLALVLGLNQLLSWGTTFYLPAVIMGMAGHSLDAPRTALVGGFSWSLIVSGICAPRMGRWVEGHGGRRVLAGGAVTMALGLVLLASAPGLALWYGAWTILGIGMALGLYDAAFATIGRLLGTEAAPAITGVTLIAGFASSVFWPAGVALVHLIGWRATLLGYAGLQLAVNLPAVLLLIPGTGPAPLPDAEPPPAHSGRVRAKALTWLASYFALRWLITSAIAVYVLTLFQALGLTAREAVVAAALIGPGQVLGRVLEWIFSARIGVLARARIGAALFPLGAAVLPFGGPVAVCVFAVLYGMSNGILTVNRGTLPMMIFGPAGYAALIGWLAVPPLLAQAAAPTLAAPVVVALPALEVLLLAGALAAVALCLLLPLRLAAPDPQLPRSGRPPRPARVG